MAAQRIALVVSTLSLSMVEPSFAADAVPVFRCPGPPVVYTDKISAEEAAKLNCRSIEGKAIEIAASRGDSSSSRWVQVASGDQVRVFADSQSIRKIGPKVRTWLRWVYSSPQETETVYPKKQYISTRQFATYDCTERTSFAAQAVRYSEIDGGDVVESFNWQESPQSYRAVVPETIGERILDYLCNTALPSKK